MRVSSCFSFFIILRRKKSSIPQRYCARERVMIMEIKNNPTFSVPHFLRNRFPKVASCPQERANFLIKYCLWILTAGKYSCTARCLKLRKMMQMYMYSIAHCPEKDEDDDEGCDFFQLHAKGRRSAPLYPLRRTHSELFMEKGRHTNRTCKYQSKKENRNNKRTLHTRNEPKRSR